MGTIRIIWLVALLAALGQTSSSLAQEKRFVTGQVIISAKSQSRPAAIQSRHVNGNIYYRSSSLESSVLSETSAQVSLKRKAHVNKEKTFTPYSRARNPCDAPPIKRLLRTSQNLVCEPNWEAKIINTPNDTLLSSMYAAGTTAAGRVYLPEAWDLSTGSANIVVGIIDTGIDYNHPDLISNIWVNPAEIASNGIDDDGNGYIDDIYGYDFINGDTDPMDDHNHGTAVAGVIGAIGNNARGVVGVNWSVKMIGCKAFNASGTGSLTAIINCLNYFVKLKRDFGVNIVVTNNSYGGFPNSNAFVSAINATREQDMVFSAGAGNATSNNDTSPFYPASFDLDNIISTMAIDSSANITSFSNYGLTSVDIAAPGIGVYTTIRSNQYGTYQGTSIATPFTTGAIALVRAYHPNYTYAQARESVLHSGTAKAGLSSYCSSGAILNVGQALQYVAAVVPTATPTSSATPIATPPPGDGSSPNLSSTKLDISVLNSKTRAAVTCELSVASETTSVGLPGHLVDLKLKGVTKKIRSTTDQQGIATFQLALPKSGSYRGRCVTKLKNQDSTETRIIRSSVVTIKRKKA